MNNDTLSSAFPSTKEDLSNLRQTARDAASDLKSTATVHANKAKDNLRDLAGHVQEEGQNQLEQVKVRLADVLDSAQHYATERPLICIGAAFALGTIFGLSRRHAR